MPVKFDLLIPCRQNSQREHTYLPYHSHRVYRKFDANEKLSNYSVKIIKVVEHDGQMSEKNSSTAMINGTATPSSVESLRRRQSDVDE